MDLRDILLIGHILGVVVMGAGVGAAMVARLSAGRSPDLRTIAAVSRQEVLGGRIVQISAVVVLLLGVWLVIEESRDFSEAWISAAFVLWIVAMAIGGGVLARHARAMRATSEAALARGETANAEVAAEFNSTLVQAAGAAIVLTFVIFIYLMVAKPGA